MYKLYSHDYFQDYQVREKETPVLSKDAQKAPKVAFDITIKNIKTSDTFVKNNTRYATVKTTKVIIKFSFPSSMFISISDFKFG